MSTSRDTISCVPQKTVTARRITYAEIEALASQGPDDGALAGFLEVESERHGRTLTPAEVSPRPVHRKARAGDTVPHQVIYAPVPDNAPNATRRFKADQERPVGWHLTCDVTTMFGMNTGLHLFTSPEAEDSAEVLGGWTDPTADRKRFYLADKNGAEMPLTPVYGAMATLGLVVADLDDEEVLARAKAALAAEFGDALTVHKAQSRPVQDKWVSVYRDKGHGDIEVLAARVLDAVAGSYARGASAFHTHEVVDD